MPDFPHAYPFRFVDTVLRPAGADFREGRVSARVSGGAWAVSEGAWGTPVLLAEAIAQAALLLEGGDAEIGRRGFLAGIESFEVARVPRAGESLSIEVKLAARFGPIVRFEGEVRSGSETIASGAILVRRGSADRESAET